MNDDPEASATSNSLSALGALLRKLWAPFGTIYLLVRNYQNRIYVLDHDALGSFNTDCDSLLFTSLNRVTPRRRGDLTVVIFPKEVANESCRALFLREMLRCDDIFVLDARASETVHFAERVLRRIVRSEGKLPRFGLRLSIRVEGASFASTPNIVDPRPLIGFTNEEQDAGWLSFDELGIPRGSSFICFNVRDSAYGSEPFPTDPEKNASHDYRNPPIHNYVPAVEFLLECGYYVVHMGKVVAHPFPVEHPQFIPYAGNSLRSNFLDVFLYAHCSLAVQGSGSGIDTLASIFNKPLCTTDGIPVWAYLHTPNNTALRVIVPALLEDIAGGRILTVREMATNGFLQNQDYKSAGVRVIPNTPDEILAATQFALHMISLDNSNNHPSLKWNEKFWQQYLDSMRAHGFNEPPNVGACGRSLLIPETFLEAHSRELFG
jgi:putative glycosyltransferase (TIGR04372 family)